LLSTAKTRYSDVLAKFLAFPVGTCIYGHTSAPHTLSCALRYNVTLLDDIPAVAAARGDSETLT
jgi:hypothetical protein